MTILAKIARAVLGPVEEARPVPVGRVQQRPRTIADVTIPDPFGRDDEREGDRFVPAVTSTVLTTTSGRRVSARVVNLSRTGVAVEAETRDLPAAEVVMVGNRKVHPGRGIGLGLVFVFEKPIDARQCHPGIVL